jgi:hypothetical protein
MSTPTPIPASSLDPAAGSGVTSTPSLPPEAVQLGPQVFKPTDGPPDWLVPDRAPDARAEGDAVVLELWVPHRNVGIGEWVTVHVRVTNEGSEKIYSDCIPLDTVLDATSLFDPGETWTGAAARFKEQLLSEQRLTRSTFSYRTGEGLDCPGGDIGKTDHLGPGDTWDIDLIVLPRYWLDNQALPPGSVPVVASLNFGFGLEGTRDYTLSVRQPIRLDGRPLPGVSPGQLADATLHTDGFIDWLEARDLTGWVNTHLSGKADSKRIDWQFFGFDGPAPNGTITMGLFAEGNATFLGEVLLDPWTGQSFGFVAR